MKTHALIVLYQGKELPKDVAADIVAVMSNAGITTPELVSINYYDDKGIADVMIKKETNEAGSNELEALRTAIAWIGRKFADYLSTRDKNQFAIVLTNLVTKTRFSLYESNVELDTQSKALLQSIELICRHKNTIFAKASATAKEWGFTKEVVEIISKVYENA